MSVITEPIILDKTGRLIADRLKSIAEKLWSEKVIEIPSKDVNFYDYDGTRVYSYDKAEFLAMEALPANPVHGGLTAQGWNWTLAQAKTYVQKYGVLDIGQTYTTDDGKTRLYIEIGYTENLSVCLKYVQSAGSIVTINWGDGNEETSEVTTVPGGNVEKRHTYADEGHYIITLDVSEGGDVKLGTSTSETATSYQAGIMFFTQGIHGRVTGKDALVGLEIGSGVSAIGVGGLAYCTNLRYVTIPNTVASIFGLAFFACKALEAVVVPSGVLKVNNLQFAYNYNAKVIAMPPTINAIGKSAFKTCSILGRLCIPEGVTALDQYVCSGLRNARDIIVPDTIEGAIPAYAFEHCYGIDKINVPDGVTSIGNYAFNNCYNLRECELPEGVTTIGQNAFASCFGFLDFVIPSTVTSIGKFAFLYNDGNNSFRIRATEPPTVEPTAFEATFGNDAMKIYVPYSEDHSILEAYKSATGWASKADDIYEEEG